MRLKQRNVLLVSLLSPVLACYLAIRGLDWGHRKPVLIFVITLFGGTIILKTSDGFVLQQLIYDHYLELSFQQWYFELKEMLFLSPEPGTKGDVFSHVSSYVFGRILGIPSQYFLFVSFVYGYFYVNALSKIVRWTEPIPSSALWWMLIILFVAYRSIDELQSVRTTTGLWVLFSGAYGYLESKKVKYVFLMLAAPLFHVAYFIIAIPALIVVFVRWLHPFFFIAIYCLSFFIQVNTGDIITALKTTDLGEEKVTGYYREDPDDYLNPLDGKTDNWYKMYGQGWGLINAPHVMAIAIVAMGLFSRKKMTSLEMHIFAIGILMATVANFGNFIPTFYNRTMTNAGTYILATTIMLLLRGELTRVTSPVMLSVRKGLLWMAVISFAPYLVYVLANIIQFMSVFMFIAPTAGFVPDANLSVRDFLDTFL